MKLACIFFVVVLSVSTVFPATLFDWGNQKFIARRLAWEQAAKANSGQDAETMGGSAPEQRSVKKAVAFSALVPGSGQFYSKSYLKAALFFAIEMGAWAVNISYNKKGDNKDAEFKEFADRHWSEIRYFSYIYHEFEEDINSEIGGSLQTTPDEAGRPILSQEDYNAYKEVIRKYENNFSHRLPHSKTQQYYEMIGKYPAQFGNAWDDASFDVTYTGYPPAKLTPRNKLYMDMRNDANRFYNIAGYGTMTALVNHILAAIDAGFTARRFNRAHAVKVEMSYKNRLYKGEYVNLFGVNVRF